MRPRTAPLGALAQALARQPESVTQRLAELLRELCRAGSAGSDHHLTKPVDVDALLGILARVGVA